GYYKVQIEEYKKALVLYTLHDAYKDPEIAATKVGFSDSSIPLQVLDKLVEKMGLRRFSNVTAEELRVASVYLQGDKFGDLSGGEAGLSAVITLVRLADSLASQQTARDSKTSENRFQEIKARNGDIFAQINRTRAGQAVEPKKELTFYYHELDDYRGLSTLLIHQATEQVLQNLSLYPILYFANGVLYIGPKGINADVNELRQKITETLFAKIKEDVSGKEGLKTAQQALGYGQGLKFQKYVYLFCSLDHMIEAIKERPLGAKNSGFMSRILEKRVTKRKYTTPEEFYTRYQIPAEADQSENFAQRWYAVFIILMGIENIAKALVPEDSLEWLLTLFKTPTNITDTIRQHSKALRDGGISDHCLIIAYHVLFKARFSEDQRSATEVPIEVVQEAFTELAKKALKPYDKNERRLNFVDETLGIRGEVANYLQTNLIFSFAPQERIESESPLAIYEKKRSGSHKPMCVICNRLTKVKGNEIITDIAEQQAQVFSNRLIPTTEVGSQMVWCPMCYLEFMLRKLNGQGYPAGTNTNTSYRLYLYLLPDYSFTPQLWEATAQTLVSNFRAEPTTVTKLPLHGSKENPALPAYWLLNQSISPEWLKEVSQMFAKQAEWMKSPGKEGKPRRKHGDHLTFTFKNPNYMLITYDNSVGEREDSKLQPTHSEIWAKALYSSVLIHLLTGARVYITDKPYLSITRPEEMKTIIEMEGLHPLLYGLLPLHHPEKSENGFGQRPSQSSSRIPLATLPIMLDLLAATWEINNALTESQNNGQRNVDKQVAHVLETLNLNRLAGATLYKERERDKAAPYPAFTRACQILLPYIGQSLDKVRAELCQQDYELMIDKEGKELMSLAQNITALSLKLYLPVTKSEGRTHRYETVFRTGVEVIKSSAAVQDENELIERVGGNLLKRLERLSGGVSPVYGLERVEVAKELAEILVRQLFMQRCGRSISKLTHEENHMADAIYFVTSQQVQTHWDEFKKRKAQNDGVPLKPDAEDKN
ncbi:MAG: type I-D CRISPR-associated protein Cas10d/Csc3, partial [Chloroflexota bacterium]